MNKSLIILVLFLFTSLVFILSNWSLNIIALLFFIVWLFHSINLTNNGLIIRNIFIIFLGLQYLFGSFLAYDYDVDSIYSMVIPAQEYFSFAIPGVLLIGLGLFYNTNKTNEDIVFNKSTIDYEQLDKRLFTKLFYISFLFDFLPFSPPESLAFVFYSISSFKYIYVCYSLIAHKKLNYFMIIIPILYLASRSLGSGMFHDFVTWLVFIGLSYSIRLKPNLFQKLIAIISFVLLVIVIQLSKHNFRAAILGSTNSESRVKIFKNTAESELDAFDKNSLTSNIVRINQGWIAARAMNYVPEKINHAGFDLISQYTEAAILPRILAPNKLKAGDRELLSKYTGIFLSVGTSMGIGILGDAWASFGYFGGLVMLFCFGLLLNYSLKYFEFLIKKFPLVYFLLPIVYYYPIRPDCETQTSFGHLVKTTFLVSIIAFYFMKKVKTKRVSLLAPQIQSA